MDNIREPAHYIYEQYGSGCTGFNLVPLQNNNKECHICADISFNPPECFLSGIDKDPDCITRCNMLPNCTSVCTSVLLLSPQYASETDETAYMDCCVPMRQQINGESALMAREQCCRDWFVVQGVSVEEARVRCCNTAALEDNFPPYCAQEICHFKILEQNMSKIRDIWVQDAVGEALENDCTGADCGIVGEVTLASDGVLGSAMVNNQLLQAEGPARQGLFFDSVDQSVIWIYFSLCFTGRYAPSVLCACTCLALRCVLIRTCLHYMHSFIHVVCVCMYVCIYACVYAHQVYLHINQVCKHVAMVSCVNRRALNSRC
jgi:hypothetical protein